MELKDYQKRAIVHMLTHKGMIAAFDTGTGKTLTAVTTAACILHVSAFLGVPVKVIVITPKSLKENFKKEMEKYGTPSYDKRYEFYTYDEFRNRYNAKKIQCSRSFLIIDEAHNLRTDYRDIFKPVHMAKKPLFATGGKKTKTTNSRSEVSIKCASDAWKVLLLTATPIYNDTSDIVNLVSMVKGLYPPLRYDPTSLDVRSFGKFFKDTILF